MDEGRKRTLCVCAAILSERHLSALEDGKSAAPQAEITQDAICKAERIMRQIKCALAKPCSAGGQANTRTALRVSPTPRCERAGTRLRSSCGKWHQVQPFQSKSHGP